MSKVLINTPAPDFNLVDYNKKVFKLSDSFGKVNTLLVFNRGFI